MSVPFLLLLLVVSGGAAGGDDGAELPHLQLRGMEDSGRGHASDAAPQGQGLMDDLLHTHGCGRFAALLAATANATEIFREHVAAAAGTGGGLTVFCPDDLAVASFEPKLGKLSADDQLAVMLYHGAAARYLTEQIAAFDSVAVRTLAADAATNKSHVLNVFYDEETVSVWLWPALRVNRSCGAARVTKEVASGESALAVYVVDRVLLPMQLWQRLEGGGAHVVRRLPRMDAQHRTSLVSAIHRHAGRPGGAMN
ncbi:hypothetical protein ACQ4PT_041829 [Festuca glaucescens]